MGRYFTNYRAPIASNGKYLVPGTWYLVPGTWYLVPGTRYLVPGTWYLDLEAVYMNDVEMKNMHAISRIYEDFMDLEVWPGGWDLEVLPACCQRSPPVANPRQA